MQSGKIDVIINAASRLIYLIPTVNSMLNNLKYSGSFRLILHDDVVKKEGSEQIRKWVEESKLFDLFITTEPARRLGHAIYKCLQLVESPFVVKWEDDWTFLKEVYLDEILEYMNSNPKVNQIAFNKVPNESHKHGILRPVIETKSFKLTTLQEWSIGPGIWRTSFVKGFWTDEADAHNTLWKCGYCDPKQGRDMKWVQENVGCYFYGGHGEGPFLDHLGIESMWNAPIEVKK